MHKWVVLDSHKQIACQVDIEESFAQSEIQGSVVINVSQEWDGDPLSIAWNRALVGQIHKLLELRDINIFFHKHMKYCFYLREDVEAELHEALSIDTVDIKVVCFRGIDEFFDDLPVQDGKAHLSNKLGITVNRLSIVNCL